MISEIRGPVWLGYRSTSGRFDVNHEDLKRGIAVLGQGANDLAALLAYACNEAGLKTLVLDMGGHDLCPESSRGTSTPTSSRTFSTTP